MFEIDRSLIVVRPKQPFLDWSQSVDNQKGLTLERVHDDPSSYLIPQLWYDDEQTAILKWCYEVVFEAELESWYTAPAVGPQNRNLKMFFEWFDIKFHSLVFDLCNDPIQIVDYGSEDTGKPNSNGN